MNILNELAKNKINKISVNNVFGNESFSFLWNKPVQEKELDIFETKNKTKLPRFYKDFLLISNGAIIFKPEEEDGGYKILSIGEMVEETQELRQAGYNISQNCYCFFQNLYSPDFLLFDLKKDNNYIIDGDVGYPSESWEYIKGDMNTFFIHLFECNGVMFWRW